MAPRPTARRDLVADDAAAVGGHHRRSSVHELEAHDFGVGQDADRLLLEVRLQQVAELLVLAMGEVRAALDDGHLGTEAPVRLRKLERHGACPDADEVPRQLRDVHQVVARHRRHDVGAGDVERPRTGTGRDQRVREGDAERAFGQRRRSAEVTHAASAHGRLARAITMPSHSNPTT